MGWVSRLWDDTRVSVRSLRRAPLFTTAAVVSLALGMGGVVTVYTVADRLLLRPFDGVRDSEALVEIVPTTLAYPVYQDLAARMRSVRGLAAHRLQSVALESAGPGSLRPVEAGIVSGNYFDLLGVAPARGRLFASGDNIPGANPVAVISYALWTEMGARAELLGSELRVNGAPFTVVGVVPPEFGGLRLRARPAVWITVESWQGASLGLMPDVHDRNWGWITVVGRLRPGVDQAGATADERVAAFDIARVHKENERDLADVVVVPARSRAADGAGHRVAQLLLALAGVVALALLAAASNVASLLLARASRRQRELGIRMALGADRFRLGQLLAVETGLVVALGLALGFGFASLALRLLASVRLPAGILLEAPALRPDVRLLGIAVALLVVVAFVTAVVPALAAARTGPARLGSSRGASASAGSLRLRASFVVIQVAVGVVLLAGTTLFGRSIMEALHVELGFESANLGVVKVNASLFQNDLEGASVALDRLVQEIRDLPGVDAASWSTAPPLEGDAQRESFEIVGRPASGRRPIIEANSVGPGFFRAAGIPLVRGDADILDMPVDVPVAVVNEAMAARYWPAGDAVGSRIAVMGLDVPVVAIAKDTRFHGFAAEPVPYAFVLRPRVQRPFFSIVLRGPDAQGALSSVGELARQVDARLVVSNTASGRTMVDFLLAPQRLGGLVTLLAALVAIGLALTGVYGIVAFGVGARLREFGVRLTLGADPERVATEVLRKNMAPVLGGIILGSVASLALTRFAAARLFGLRGDDPATAVLAAGAVLAMAVLATWIPARRAGQVDPASVLAAE